MKNPEHRKKSVHRIYRMLLIFLTLLAVLVPTVFTAVQMGVFAKEPVLETKPMTTDPNAPLLRVATDYDFCPNSYINQKGDLSGLYIEIITEAANRLGMRLEFKTGTWMECRAMLENKSADVLLGLEIFSNMEGTLRTIPMCSDQLCVYGKNALTSAAALSGKRVALMVRSVIEATYDLQCEYVEYYTNTDILRAVEDGDVDYGICHAAVASKIISYNHFDLQKGVAIANSFPAMAVDDSRPELDDKLNTVLQGMSVDGTIGRLITKWLTKFSQDRSFHYVLQDNVLFYATFFLSLAVAYSICIAALIFDRQQDEYIQSLLSYQHQLKKSNEEAQLANQAKSRFLSHMSHDIRTPINGIMGMAIVYNLVNRMGGMVMAESTLGVGSTFTVRLTFDRNPGPKPRPSREAAPADISGMRVLVAEDNALNLEIAQTMLEEAGARVTTAVNGALAVECFREANPGTFDAILMDIMMPVMDGLAATRAIRSLPREDAATVPIIATTAKAFTEDREKVFDAGMNEYLTKPIDFAKLHTVLAGYRK